MRILIETPSEIDNLPIEKKQNIKEIYELRRDYYK